MIFPAATALTFDLNAFNQRLRAEYPDLVTYEIVQPVPCAALSVHARFGDGTSRTLQLSGLTLLDWGAYRRA